LNGCRAYVSDRKSVEEDVIRKVCPLEAVFPRSKAAVAVVRRAFTVQRVLASVGANNQYQAAGKSRIRMCCLA